LELRNRSGNGTESDDDSNKGGEGEAAGGGCDVAELRRACDFGAYWGVSERKEPRSRSLGTTLETSRRRSKAEVKSRSRRGWDI
jgi:hypothetical protein